MFQHWLWVTLCHSCYLFSHVWFFQQQQEGGGDTSCRNQNQTHLRWCSFEFNKLLRKIQGAPFLSPIRSDFEKFGNSALTIICKPTFFFISAGVPPLADHTQLELSVVYNACVCATAQSQFTETEMLLTQSTERGRTALQWQNRRCRYTGTNSIHPASR